MEQIVIAGVDEDFKVIQDTEQVIDCDTLLLSCGLIPENELTIKAGAILLKQKGYDVIALYFDVVKGKVEKYKDWCTPIYD